MSHSVDVVKLEKGNCFVINLQIQMSIEKGNYEVDGCALELAIYDFVKSFLVDYCKVD